MELTKLFDQREQTGIPKLIDHIKSSVDVLPKTECFVMWEDSKVVDNVGEMLRLAEETLIELQPVIDVLRTRRDKYYAHNDRHIRVKTIMGPDNMVHIFLNFSN